MISYFHDKVRVEMFSFQINKEDGFCLEICRLVCKYHCQAVLHLV
jgi:hypothetical protein